MATETTQPGLGQRHQHRRDGSGPSAGSTHSRAAHRHYPGRTTIPSLDARTLAEGVGWFSVALGAAALLAPRSVGTLVGVGRGNRSLTRSVGVRELATGIGILSQRNPAPWLWSRVVGDVMDLAMLAVAKEPGRGRAIVSFAALTGILAVDALAASQLTRHRGHPLISGVAAPTDLYFETSIATTKSPDECYRFWRNVENLPRFMDNLQSVQALDAGSVIFEAASNGRGTT